MTKLSKIFSQNKKALILTMGMVLILSFLPSHFILATPDATSEFCPGCGVMPWEWPACLKCLFEYIASLPMRFGFFVLMLPTALTALFTGLLYSVTVALSNWMIYISMSVGITPANPITIQAVTIGWTFARDFVNMFFILILVFIGLATILKIREYEAKKTLPKLLIIVLLINFTPVIVGFIVDMGNIVTNFLLSKAAQITILPTVLNMVWNYFDTALLTIFYANGSFFENFVSYLGQFIGIIIYGVAVIIFFLLGTWIYFWVMLIFFLRIVELWILMILSPIAFFSYILPPGGIAKRLFPSILHWDKWWEEFLQWIIVGIPLGFFLYLSNWIMVNQPVVEEIFQKEVLMFQLGEILGNPVLIPYSPPDFTKQFISLVTTILAPTVALVLLWKGYKIAKETAPAAARAIIDYVKEGAKLAAALGITAVTAGAGAGAVAGALGKAAAGAQRLETFMGGKAGFTVAGRRVEPLKWAIRPITAPIRGLEMAAGPTLERYAMLGEEAASKAGEEAKKGDVMDNLRAFRRTFDPAQKREILSTMVDLNQVKDALDLRVVGKYNTLTREEILKAYEDARKKRKISVAEKFEQVFVKDDTIRAGMANIVDKVTAKLAPDEQTGVAGRPSGLARSDVEKGYTSFAQKIIGEAKTAEEVKRLQKGWWSDANLMEAAQKFWGGPQLGKAAEEFGRKFVEDYMTVAEARPRPTRWYLENNQRALVYLSGSAAQDLGFRSIKGISRAEARELVERWRARRTIPPGQTRLTP